MPIKKYIKKPVVIEAGQWNEIGDHSEVVIFREPDDFSGEKFCGKCNLKLHDHGWIDELPFGAIVCPGDWVIRGVQGEYSTCNPDIFEDTYDQTW